MPLRRSSSRRAHPGSATLLVLLFLPGLAMQPARAEDEAVRALLSQGEAALRRQDLLGALRSFRAAAEQAPDSWEARDGMGRVFRASGDLQAAQREMRRAVDLAPATAPAARNLTDLLPMLPEAERRDGLRWLVERGPDSAEILLFIAREARDLGDLNTTAAALARVRAIAPDDKEAMVEEILLHRSTLNYERAEELALAFVARFPDYPETYEQLGRIYRLQNRLEEAEAQYRKALELEPMNPAALLRVGEILLERGQPEAALEPLRAAATMAPDYYEPHYLLSRALLLLGQPEAAEIEMERFREIKDRLRESARRSGGAGMVDE